MLSYGPVAVQSSPRLAVQIDKILKGTRPTDLPVEQPTKFELVINMKMAKARGVAIPQSLLFQTNQVIEYSCATLLPRLRDGSATQRAAWGR